MMMSAAALLSSCDKEEAPTDTEVDNTGRVSVVRAITTLDAGTKIERKDFQEVMVEPESVPEGAYATIDEVVNKFLAVKVFSGDVLVAEKIGKTAQASDERNDIAAEYEEYVLVTKYTTGVSGDLSDAIQKAIDENPNKTIYFPEGKYNLKKPIKTSADPAECVSLKLATHATLIAAGNEWAEGAAVVELGARGEIKSQDAISYMIGGIIQTDKKCNGITVAGGNVLINNVSVKSAKIGLTVNAGARTDVDSCVITGDSTKDAIGMLLEGEESTFINMRIAGITYGVKLTGSNNVLRNIHPLGGRADMVNSTGFWDLSKDGNFYDICYSDQFANSFRLGDNVPSVFSGCFGYWYDGSNGNHYGFYVEGKFAAISVNTRIALNNSHAANCNLSYAQVKDGGGEGVIVYPRLPNHSVDSKGNVKTPDEFYGKGEWLNLKDYAVTDIMG